MTKEDLNLLYKSIMFFNESRSILFISNRQVDKWKDATDDKHLIQTLIDRITRDSSIIMLEVLNGTTPILVK